MRLRASIPLVRAGLAEVFPDIVQKRFKENEADGVVELVGGRRHPGGFTGGLEREQ